jgi:DNA invertase Pin-like site-specific DNA recombinase
MNTFYGYVRVSTVKQGTQGVSLEAQRDSIAAYASRNGWQIVEWFEELQTAAKRGRPILARMMKQLRAGKAHGVIMHKIDRGARNLRDWADLAELMDTGIVVHFANDGLDMSSRGGRLSADIQAVVAADFIRNLSEETKKGLQGRLKQGLWPYAAPIGYLDHGRAQPKSICPVIGPLIRQAFELYATGRFTLKGLTRKVASLGLINKSGGKVSMTGVTNILKNPFYTGIMYIKRTGETFAGVHEPLVSKQLFDRVQEQLQIRSAAVVQVHDFTFRRLLSCRRCRHLLVGEVQKGHVYYRCHSDACRGTIVPEREVELAVKRLYSEIALPTSELTLVSDGIQELRRGWQSRRDERRRAIAAKMAHLNRRLSQLADAYLDGVLDRVLFETKKRELLEAQAVARDELAGLPEAGDVIATVAFVLLDRGTGAYYAHDRATDSEKRNLLKSLTSNRAVDVKDVALEPVFPFDQVISWSSINGGCPVNNDLRTIDKFVKGLWDEAVRRLAEGLPDDESL